MPLETNAEEQEWPPFINTSGREGRVLRTYVYDHTTQIHRWTTYKRWHEGGEEHTKITRTALRYTFPRELAALLYYNGFSIERQYGDWNLESLTADSPSTVSGKLCLYILIEGGASLLFESQIQQITQKTPTSKQKSYRAVVPSVNPITIYDSTNILAPEEPYVYRITSSMIAALQRSAMCIHSNRVNLLRWLHRHTPHSN